MKRIEPMGLENTQISIENEQVGTTFADSHAELIRKAVMGCLKAEGIPVGCEIEIVITDDAAIRQTNRAFRNIDKATDVLSFPVVHMKEGQILSDEGDLDLDQGLLMLGDIVISIETAQEQAVAYGHSLERELAFLATHGTFHLLGYDHMVKSEEAVMMDKQEAVLESLGLKRV